MFQREQAKIQGSYQKRPARYIDKSVNADLIPGQMLAKNSYSRGAAYHVGAILKFQEYMIC
ncbi:MAG TPA: hypothetical protein PKN87_04960 [Syntrophomonadaceae bacterium]|nr:hypothetical protein [Syntrophomonadaceae bacterium]HPR92844.1 hypothetical protein [Syntrophomonadaceae bacterium]